MKERERERAGQEKPGNRMRKSNVTKASVSLSDERKKKKKAEDGWISLEQDCLQHFRAASKYADADR